MRLVETPLHYLEPGDNLLQSPLWGATKENLGQTARAFSYEIEGRRGRILTVLSDAGGGRELAYAPWAPDDPVPETDQGHFLESLGTLLSEALGGRTIFVRFDLPWRSPYPLEGEPVPESRVREMRMNFGTEQWALRKAPSDVQPPHTLLLDLTLPEGRLFERMHPKTRYNIRLARRRGVVVREGSPEELSRWYQLYRETMRRNGTTLHERRFFDALLYAGTHQERQPGSARTRLILLLAEQERRLRSGMILAIQGEYALYLYGASASAGRRSMSTYALQWEAIRRATSLGARIYDFSGIPEDDNPSHPMHGLLRFKLGFGGSHVVRRGCWDYPILEDEYPGYAGFELTDRGYHRPG
ncbi:MAG: lipid II:glycine glycyltransferase FemX [Alkalispirochaetaceae bacterium]